MHVVVVLDKILAESQENKGARCQFAVEIQIYPAFNGMSPDYACYRNICYIIHPVSDQINGTKPNLDILPSNL